MAAQDEHQLWAEERARRRLGPSATQEEVVAFAANQKLKRIQQQNAILEQNARFAPTYDSETATMEEVSRVADHYWDWKVLTARPDISTEFMMHNPTYPWDVVILTQRVPLRHVIQYPRFKWRAGTWDRATLSLRTEVFPVLGRLVHGCVPLDWTILSAREDIDIEYIMANKHFPWDWHVVQRRGDFTHHVAAAHPDIPIDWKFMTQNTPFQFMEGNNHLPWDEEEALRRHALDHPFNHGVRYRTGASNTQSFKDEIPTQILDQEIAYGSPVPDWDWVAFTNRRASLRAIAMCKNIPWRIESVAKFLKPRLVTDYGPMLLRHNPRAFLEFMDAYDEYVERVKRGEEEAVLPSVQDMSNVQSILHRLWRPDGGSNHGDVQTMPYHHNHASPHRLAERAASAYGGAAAGPYNMTINADEPDNAFTQYDMASTVNLSDLDVAYDSDRGFRMRAE